MITERTAIGTKWVEGRFNKIVAETRSGASGKCVPKLEFGNEM